MAPQGFNPALNLAAFAAPSPQPAPPALNALYLRDGKYDGMTRAGVAASFAAFTGMPDGKRLALFFHGGLVDKPTGQKAGALQYERYKDVALPIFVIWESGIWEVLAHHLPLIFAETIFGQIKSKAIAAAVAKVPAGAPPVPGQPAAFAAPGVPATDEPSAEALANVTLTAADVDAFMSSIAGDLTIQNAAAAIAMNSNDPAVALAAPGFAGAPAVASPVTMLSPSVVGAIRGAYFESAGSAGFSAAPGLFRFDPLAAIRAAAALAKAAAPVLINVFKRFQAHRDHGLTCTVVEELLRALYGAKLGSSIWEEMKKETEDAFGADSAIFGGTALIEEIVALPPAKRQKITLVGHSTGAVYIGNFLRHADAALTAAGDVTTKFDVVLMAPANTMDFYEANYGKRVAGIRLFGMQDATEQRDLLMSSDVAGGPNASILGQVYPRSLLYLVAGVCESFEGAGGTGLHNLDSADMPLFGMDRFFAQSTTFPNAEYPSVKDARARFADPHDFGYQRVLSPTDPAAGRGLRSTSLKHGNFPGDDPTIDSVRFCFTTGLVAPHA
jgi:hypothetical protein